MGFMDLPNEILEMIIKDSLPDGFEGLALSCKQLYAFSTPYLEHHNYLRRRFRDFCYGTTEQTLESQTEVTEFCNSVFSSFNLIARIASEPIVAEYIQTAAFTWDTSMGESMFSEFITSPYFCEQAVKDLLAHSPYLKEAGLDWEKYFTAMVEECCDLYGGYSHHAAVFVLTLLPNLKELILPDYWRLDIDSATISAPNKLFGVVLQKARTANWVYNRPGLAKVTKVKGDLEMSQGLYAAFPFLALPNIKYLECPCFRSSQRLGQQDNDGTAFISGVEEIYLYGTLLHEMDMANLLKHTPHLKTLTYWASLMNYIPKPAGDPANWYPSRQFATIADLVGGTLEHLHIDIGEIPPGKFSDSSALSMSGFKQLKTLEIPLQSAVCNFMAAGPEGPESWLLTNLVPASISKLALVAQGTEVEASALKTLFHDFAASIHPQLSNLGEIHLTRPQGSSSAFYAEQYRYLATEANKVGVVFQGTEYISHDNNELEYCGFQFFDEYLESSMA